MMSAFLPTRNPTRTTFPTGREFSASLSQIANGGRSRFGGKTALVPDGAFDATDPAGLSTMLFRRINDDDSSHNGFSLVRSSRASNR